jgi:uncharacterized protein YbjT (DUF2867 family)
VLADLLQPTASKPVIRLCCHIMRTALVAGATGLVGSHCVELLLARPDIERVHIVVRRAPERALDHRLVVHVVDFERLAVPDLRVDDVYLCLGTTMKLAGSREAFRRVDHDYTVAAGQLAKAAGAARAGLVSSVGASERAMTFYLRVKAETERDVAALGFDRLCIARPSFLDGERRARRPGEGAGIAISKAFAFTMIGALRSYRPIHAHQVAAGLIAAVAKDGAGTETFEHDALVRLAAQAPS